MVSLELVDNSRVVAERHLQVFADWKPCINDDDNEVERLAFSHGFDDLFSMFSVSAVGVVDSRRVQETNIEGLCRRNVGYESHSCFLVVENVLIIVWVVAVPTQNIKIYMCTSVTVVHVVDWQVRLVTKCAGSPVIDLMQLPILLQSMSCCGSMKFLTNWTKVDLLVCVFPSSSTEYLALSGLRSFLW